MSHGTGLRAMLRQLAKEPTGFATNAVPYADKARVADQACILARKGELHRARASHKDIRYFDTAERAAAYVREKHKALPAVNVKPLPHQSRATRAQFGPDDPIAGYSADYKFTPAKPIPDPLRTGTHNQFN